MAEQEPTTETKEEVKAEESKKVEPKLDSSKPLTGQVNKLLNSLPKEEETKEEEKKDDVESKEDKPAEEPKEAEKETEGQDDSGAGEQEPETPEETTRGVLDEVPYKEPENLPPVSQYILERLPELQVVGHVNDGQDKIFKVKRLEDLPDDFEFASRRGELAFMASLSSQEINARQLLTEYQQKEQQNQYQEYLNKEAEEVAADLAALQKEGILPKFQYNDDDPKFNTDPAVKEANEIYELFKKTNDAYAKEGRTYRISYRDAADKFYAAKARRQPQKEEVKETKPSQERQQVANKVSAPQGSDRSKQVRPLRPGTTPRDIYKLYNQGVI